jgi:transglycosylase-like protein with SLT domain
VASPPQTLAEIELAFERSRHRATARRCAPRRRKPWFASRSVRARVLAAVLLALLAESTRLEASNAKAPTPRARSPRVAATCPVPKAFRAAFVRASALTGVPRSLLVATAYEESRMDPGALSPAGARGLLQLMPSTARAPPPRRRRSRGERARGCALPSAAARPFRLGGARALRVQRRPGRGGADRGSADDRDAPIRQEHRSPRAVAPGLLAAGASAPRRCGCSGSQPGSCGSCA